MNDKTNANGAEAVFSTSLGDIIGYKYGNVIRATGIPYARASRFEKPTAVEELRSPYHAKNPSPICPQSRDLDFTDILGGDLLDEIEQSENCLNLSITIPGAFSDNEKLPVMVWIHGGGYISGGGDAAMFDPVPLVEEQNVICVSLSFRLGLLGFLGGYENRPANLGLLDIIEALKWIHLHIADFGGDRENITLFGQSAGGDTIAHLMISEGAEGLFKNVIIQSAPLGLIYNKAPLTQKMIQQASALHEEASVSKVLDVQKKALKAASGFGLKSGMPFGVQYGYYPLPAETGLNEKWKRAAQRYNVLIGYAKKETGFFIPILNNLNKVWNIPAVGGFLKSIFIGFSTGSVYGRPAKSFAKRHKHHKGRGFLYRIDWKAGGNAMGPVHTIDIPLIFGRYDYWKKAELVHGITEIQIENDGKKIRRLWADFARSNYSAELKSVKGLIHVSRL